MSNSQSPSNRALAAELKMCRAISGLTVREVSDISGLCTAKVSRTENSQREITVPDTEDLLSAYGVTGAKKNRILALAYRANLAGWRENRDIELTSSLRAVACFESQAARIVSVAPLTLPSLLQTPDYTRAVLRATGFPAIEEIVESRQRRRQVLFRPRAPKYIAIIDESVLRRVAGSPALMAAQCKYLIELAELHNVEIRIVPFDAGLHAGIDGRFLYLDFDHAGPIAFVEGPKYTMFVDADDETRPFRESIQTLLRTALSSPKSVNLLHEILAGFVVSETQEPLRSPSAAGF